MKKHLLLVTALIVTIIAVTGCCNKPTATADYNVIPLPNSIAPKGGDDFILRKSTVISYPEGNETLRKTAGFLSDYIYETTGLRLSTVAGTKSSNAIALRASLADENPEAYTVSVNAKSVTIDGASEAGTFYGVQTLRKSIPVCSEGGSIALPQVEIAASPRFGYRGMHMDVVRHFFDADFVKKYIDILALHNVNRLHWHLTDDQGWRIEIKKYPKLAEVGQWRKETLIGHPRDGNRTYDGTPYGGYFTQDQIRDIIQYAAERHITIIPEIDLPGHMLAALSAYPEYGCTGGPYEAEANWGVFPDILCMGNDATYAFLEDIFAEVVDLFPSEYIHIGGDEAPKVRWEACPKCQAKIKQLNIKGTKEHSAENQLQSYSVRRLEEYLSAHGRKLIGWDEILEGGVNGDAVIMSWRGTRGGIEAANLGHDVIMTPNHTLYFDYYQSEDRESEPLGIGGYVPVEKVYAYEPIPEELTPEQGLHIIGVQANLWTEYIAEPEHMEYMLLPRLAALSEVQWAQSGCRDYDGFLSRLSPMFDLYDKLGYNYAKHVYDRSKAAAATSKTEE